MQEINPHTFHLVQYDAEGWSLNTIQFRDIHREKTCECIIPCLDLLRGGWKRSGDIYYVGA